MRIPRPTGPRSSRVPAFIMPLAALCVPLPGAALPLRPPLRCAERKWCDHDYPRWDAHLRKHTYNPPVLGALASIVGSELLSQHGSGPSLCPTPNT
jgi:hypothetical protein